MENHASLGEPPIHPNKLTLFRILAVPGIVVLMLFPNNHVTTFLAAILFSLAAITDYLDGHWARQHGLVSNMGKFMDPLADKMLVICSLIMLVAAGRVPGWAVCIIAGRELAITGLRGIAAEKGVVIAAEKLGKWKMGFQIGATIPLLLHFDYFWIPMHLLGSIALYVAVFFTILSGLDYFKNFSAIIKE